jgi:TRAP-type C4-dicarboxylate transport system permease small subunit
MEGTRPGGVEAVLRKVCLVANRTGGVVLTFLVIVLVADVFGRFIDYPVLGSYEIVQYGFGLVICLSVAHASLESGQIAIDLIFGSFPKGLQRFFTAMSEILAVFMFALIVWRLGAAGVESFRISERSTTLGIPVSIFEFALCLGFVLLACVLILQFVKTVRGRG